MNGKIAVVTASTAGIGLATVRKLLQSGATVHLSSRKQANVDSTVDKLRSEFGNDRVFGQVCHVSNSEHRDRLLKTVVETHGKLDYLVSNAAANPYFGPITKTPEKAWETVMKTNLISSAMLINESIDFMSEGSSIVMVSSISGVAPMPNIGAYGVSKAALNALVENYRVTELAQRGIRINSISPGTIETDFSKPLWDNPEAAKNLKVVDMARTGKTEEVAELIEFLLSKKSSYITGENINISGGMKNLFNGLLR